MERVALITGASGGIGLELSKIFAQDGYNVVLVARNEDKLVKIKNAIERKYGVRAYVFACDLKAEDAANKVLEFTSEHELSVDVLVNNAGFGDCGAFAKSDWEKQQGMVRLNVIALMHLTHLYLPQMIERGEGRILNIASVASVSAGPNMSVYYATKAFVRSFSEAIAEEAAPYGVSVTALCPGPVDTGFEKTANVQDAPAFNLIPLADPHDVALCGYRALMKRRKLVYYGIAAKAMAVGVRFLPASLCRKLAGKLNDKGE